MADGLARLAADAATTFRLDAAGRIVSESPPDLSPGPRFFMASCPAGYVAHVRRDVADRTADELLAITAATPSWTDPTVAPASLKALTARLSRDSPVEAVNASLIYGLPHGLTVGGPPVVCSGTAAGEALLDRLDRLDRDGMPAHLVEAGFVSMDDFWTPWCAAIDDGEIAALCFAARLTDGGAAAGVYTFPAWRGRGFAAAVTAAWSRHPELAGRTLGYSTLVTNTSSQRVAARLALPLIGLGLRIT